MSEKPSPLEVSASLVKVARQVLNHQIDPILGIREICSLRWDAAEPEAEVFDVFRATESETDHFLFGDARTQCSDAFLQKMDAQKAQYILKWWSAICEGCAQLIEKFDT